MTLKSIPLAREIKTTWILEENEGFQHTLKSIPLAREIKTMTALSQDLKISTLKSIPLAREIKTQGSPPFLHW